MIEDDVRGTSISVLMLHLMESWTFINWMMDLKWDEASWALRVGPFRGALPSDKVDTLLQTDWVLGGLCYSRDIIYTSTISFKVLIPCLSLIIPILSLNFLPVLLQPTPNSRPQSWWLCDPSHSPFLWASCMKTPCPHPAKGVLPLGTRQWDLEALWVLGPLLWGPRVPSLRLLGLKISEVRHLLVTLGILSNYNDSNRFWFINWQAQCYVLKMHSCVCVYKQSFEVAFHI